MALKPCRECNKKVSTEATVCPLCGVPNPTIKQTRKSKEEKSSGWGGMFSGYESELTSDDNIVTKKKPKQNKPVYKEKITPRTSIQDNQSPVAFLKGDVDLPLAFWGYGMAGSILAGLILGFLSAVSIIFIYLFIVIMIGFIIGLWNCASSHNQKMLRSNKSRIWGILVQVSCVMSSLSLINFIREFF